MVCSIELTATVIRCGISKAGSTLRTIGGKSSFVEEPPVDMPWFINQPDFMQVRRGISEILCRLGAKISFVKKGSVFLSWQQSVRRKQLRILGPFKRVRKRASWVHLFFAMKFLIEIHETSDFELGMLQHWSNVLVCSLDGCSR